MDEPARKRRKTTSPGRESSPLKNPPRRPSFASPTKASISRFNPSLLAKQNTSGAPMSDSTSRGGVISRGQQARNYILGLGQESNPENGVPVAPEESLAGAEEQRMLRPGLTTPSKGKTNRTRDRTQLLGERAVEDADGLPSTPSRRLEEQDTPRRGVLFSSPSKRPLRGKNPPKPSARESESRGLRKSPDPEEENRKQEKERLLNELRELEGDISYCSKFIGSFQDSATPQALNQAERDGLISYINRVNDSEMSDSGGPKPLISELLSSFLPFRAISNQSLVPPPSSENPIPSHAPIDQEDCLPYLQMFSSLDITVQTSLLNLEMANSLSLPILQKHEINLRGPRKLLNVSVEATVNTATHEVTGLHLRRLSGWAEFELGTFMREKAQEKDISTACWAVESYWEMAKKRAEYRQQCEVAFSHLFPGRTRADKENTVPSNGKASLPELRKEFHRQLGCDVVVLADRHVLLKITWRISFDWTGEAQSEINIEPAFPSVWTETDEGQSLKKIPDTFNNLLQRSGMFEATKTIVALLFTE